MFIARITRKVLVGMNGCEDRVFKNEMIDTNLPSLLTKIFMTYNDNEILEIHITKQEEKE